MKYSSRKEITNLFLSSNSPHSIQALQQWSYLCQKQGQETQGQFSEKDSGTLYFLEGEDGQENKLQYEKAEWKTDQFYPTHSLDSTWSNTLQLWKTVMQVSQLLTWQMNNQLSQNPSVLPKSTRHQHQCMDPHDGWSSTSLKGCVFIQNCSHAGNSSCKKFFCNILQTTVLFLKQRD